MARIADLEKYERKRSLLARLGDGVRHLLLLAVLLGAAGVIAWMYAHSRADSEICACVQKKLVEFYAGQAVDVSIESARRIEGKGIELRQLKIGQFGDERPIIEVDEVFLACSTDLSVLMSQKIDVRHIEVRRPKLRAVRDLNGEWNLVKLLRRQQNQLKIPTITIENGRIEVRDLGRETGKSFNLYELNVDVTPTPDVTQPHLVWGDAVGEPNAPPPLDVSSDLVRLRGWLTGDHLRRADVDAYLNIATGSWSIKGSVDELALAPPLFDTLPGEVANRVSALTNLRGTVRLGFQAERSATDQALPRFLITGELADARYEDARLPAPLTELQARLTASNRELKLEELTAKCGPASLKIAVHSLGYADDSPLSIRAETRGFELNDQVATLLPDTTHPVWSKFAPRGTINADASLQFDGQKWKPEVTIECLDVSFAYHRFPFRLFNSRGTILFKDGLLSSENLQALANERTMRFNFQIRDPGEKFYGWVELASEGAVPLDEKLLIALDVEQEKVVRSLRPRGEVTVWGRFGRRQPSDTIERRLDIGLRNCHIDYVQFPYPLDRVSGTLSMTNGQWEFRDLRGQNDSAYIECKGNWQPSPTQGHQLRLTFEATDVPLDDELKNSLRSNMQRFWSTLRPRGTVDHLTANVQYETANKQLSLDVRAEKWPPKQNVEGRSITVQPTWLPYQWDNVVGEVRYRDGDIELKDLRASHGRTSLQLAGRGNFAADGRWGVSLSKLIADRMTIDQELMSALPTAFGETASRLNFTGPVAAQGTLELTGSSQPGETPRANWNLTLDVENGSVKVGLPLQQIRGSVQLIGAADHKSFYSQGELDVHSVICNDIQLTQIKGPIRIDPTRVVFGDFWSDQKTLNRPPRQVTGKVFGGSASSDAVVLLGPELQFDVLATLNDADMALISRDALPNKRDITGRAFATLRLQGTDKGTNSFRGNGRMQLRGADLYDVPVASSVFNRLKVRRNDANFTSCDSEFSIQGDRAYFKQLDLVGKAFTLKGTGEASLDRQINLSFYTMLGREENKVPFLTPVLTEASRQLLEIHVNGTLDEPKITQRAVPVINDALRSMFPELAERADARAESRDESKGLIQRLQAPRQFMEQNGLLPAAPKEMR